MSDTKVSEIDTLLQDTWLTVIGLRHGPVFDEGEGQRLWQRCVDNLEQVQQTLRAAGHSEQSCQHILYAQCALLDEAAKGRGVRDDACMQWYDRPLQGHFFGSINAGVQLYERMNQVLREPSPEMAVLTCFHRVLMLGFLGGASALDAPERVRLVRELAERVPAFDFSAHRPVLVAASDGLRMDAGLHRWPVRLGLSAGVLMALWLGLSRWLNHLINTLLPGIAS